MRHSFHQMPLGEESKEMANFYTHEGIYRFKRLVMGAGSASQALHERLRQSIVDLVGVEQIEDDLLVYGGDQQEHDNHLNAVLDRLQSLGLTLLREKCVWSAPEVIWFGVLQQRYVFVRKTKLVVDRGPKGISATLFQKETESGHFKTINYSSRTLTKIVNAPVESESLAIIFGVTTNRIYLHGMKFDVISDHKPLVSLYNNPRKQAPARIENHRLKLQQYRMTLKYEKRSTNPTDYNSRHALLITDQQMKQVTEEIVHINAIIDNDIPDAMTFEMVQKETNADDQLARLKFCILEKRHIPENALDLLPFRHVFEELSVAWQVVLRGERNSLFQRAFRRT